MMPIMVPIEGENCAWSMTDRGGYSYPHGIPARTRVSGAGEFLNGTFCLYHAALAVELSYQRLEDDGHADA